MFFGESAVCWVDCVLRDELAWQRLPYRSDEAILLVSLETSRLYPFHRLQLRGYFVCARGRSSLITQALNLTIHLLLPPSHRLFLLITSFTLRRPFCVSHHPPLVPATLKSLGCN